MLALNIGSDQLDTFEWTGKHVPAVHKNSQPDFIGDDEVLKMFASHSGVNQGKIIIEYLFYSFSTFFFIWDMFKMFNCLSGRNQKTR